MNWNTYLFDYYGLKTLKDIKGCLSDFAFDSATTKGRRLKTNDNGYPYEDVILSDCMNPFLFDLNKILQSKAFRRLKDKTQVFINTDSCHITTRAKHTHEVMSIGMTLAELLGLNVYLVQAICAGHDIGHGPYGHLGEMVYLDKFGKKFKHDVFSVVVAQKIERSGGGLNLSFETLEGISLHSGSIAVIEGKPLEYTLVRLADKIAYVFGDINDVIRNGMLNRDDLPSIISEFGATQRERVMKLICEIVVASAKAGRLVFTETELGQKFLELRKWMFDNVYFEVDREIHKEALRVAFKFLNHHFPERAHILWPLLTDREVDDLARLALRSRTITLDDIKHFSIMEIIETFDRYNSSWDIDIHDLDLNWVK